MTGDPTDGIDPRDIEELRQLFEEISAQHRKELSDDAGLTDTADVRVYAEVAEGQGSAPDVRAVTAEAYLTVTAHAVATGHLTVAAGVDPTKLNRLRELALRLARFLTVAGAGGMIGDACSAVARSQWDSHRDEVQGALDFAELILSYLRDG